MRKLRTWAFLSFGCLVGVLILAGVIADEEDEFGRVDNMTYKEHCGACHLAYQPALLPSGSWCKILSGLASHNGVEVVIEEETNDLIKHYLEKSAAEHSSAKRASKIMRSLNGQTPTRITDVPYIRHKHHEVPPDVFERESIGSFSNCNACHSTAEEGKYEDDYVSIPE